MWNLQMVAEQAGSTSDIQTGHNILSRRPSYRWEDINSEQYPEALSVWISEWNCHLLQKDTWWPFLRFWDISSFQWRQGERAGAPHCSFSTTNVLHLSDQLRKMLSVSSLISVHPLKQDRTSMDRVAQLYFLFNEICVPLLWWRNICDDFMFSQRVWPFFHPHSCVKSGESHPAEQTCSWSPSGCPEPNDELSRSAVWSLSLTWCNATQRFSAAVLPPGSTLAAPQ